MLAVQHLSVTGGTVLAGASALLPEWQFGSLPLAQPRAEIQVWISVRLRGLMIVRGASGLFDRRRRAAAPRLREPQRAPPPPAWLRAWLRVPTEALLLALTPDRVGPARGGKAPEA